jgi:hypothetical protein
VHHFPLADAWDQLYGIESLSSDGPLAYGSRNRPSGGLPLSNTRSKEKSELELTIRVE